MNRSKLKEPILVYRCLKKNVVDKMEIGMKFIDNGFMSTSSSDEIFETGFGQDAYKLTLRVPKGTKAFSVMDYSIFSDEEKEVLLDSGMEYKVVKIDGDNIVCEVQEKK